LVTQQRAADTQGSIIRGAAAVFAQHGYGEAALSEITKAAGVTKGALYFHYPSKETLALAVIEEQHRIATSAGAAVRGLGRPALETVVRILRSFSGLLLDDAIVRAGIRLTFEASAFNADVTHPYLDWSQAFEVLLKQAIVEGDVNPSLDAAEFARLIVGSYTGVQMVSNVLTGRDDLLQVAGSLCKYLLPAIVPISRSEIIPPLQSLWFK